MSTAPRAVVRRPSPKLADGLVTHIEKAPLDPDLALVQWQGYVDALAAARSVLAGDGTSVPKSTDGWVEALRALNAERAQLVTAIAAATIVQHHIQALALNHLGMKQATSEQIFTVAPVSSPARSANTSVTEVRNPTQTSSSFFDFIGIFLHRIGL